jgi:hypothetical protein
MRGSSQLQNFLVMNSYTWPGALHAVARSNRRRRPGEPARITGQSACRCTRCRHGCDAAPIRRSAAPERPRRHHAPLSAKGGRQDMRSRLILYGSLNG